MKKTKSFPRTLLQLHYHNAPCGVMQVIRHYATAFNTIMGSKESRTILICEKQSKEKYPEFPDDSIISFPLAGYKTFKSKNEFLAARKKIITRLASLLLSGKYPAPIAIVAHNMTLCKNAALVSAFAELARAFASQGEDYRFFSVVHDFAEEGRIDQLREIRKMESWGISVRDDIACSGAPVRFIAIHQRAKSALDKSGVNVSFLPNPVIKEPVAEKPDELLKKKFRKYLLAHARKVRIPFKPDNPVFAYHVRTIIRKNPFEALLVACIIYEGNLLLGGPGSKAIDKKRHATTRNLAKKCKLPVITDIQDNVLQNRELRKLSGNNPVPLIYSGIDAVLSTAITEGFGYLLHEPWLYEKPVCGRIPVGFNFINKGMDRGLYHVLPIPAEWVDLIAIQKKYADIAEKCFENIRLRKRFIRDVFERVSGRYIDFAFLDESSQIKVIEKLASSEIIRNEWVKLLEKKIAGWPGISNMKTPARGTILRIKRETDKKFSNKKFVGKFKNVIQSVPKMSAGKIDWEAISGEYGAAGAFRIS